MYLLKISDHSMTGLCPGFCRGQGLSILVEYFENLQDKSHPSVFFHYKSSSVNGFFKLN